MALDPTAVMEPAIAHVLLNTANAVAPTSSAIDALDATNPTISGWTNFGHTSLDNDFAPFNDGGDSTIRGSRQNPKLRESLATTTDGVDISSIQVSSETLNYFYGGGTAATGSFTIPSTSTAIQKAVLIVYFDGTSRAAEYHSLASIRRNGAYRNGATGWLEFPIRFTWLTGTNADKWLGSKFAALS